MAGAVYVGVNSEKGNVVPEEEAYGYAFERCTNGSDEDIQEFKKMLVEWFYSGDWIKYEKGEREEE